MHHGFIRVGCYAPRLRVADLTGNRKALLAALQEANKANISLLVFPELCLSGYTCQDLFFDSTLLDAAQSELLILAKESSKLPIAYMVGFPFAWRDQIYNTAAVIAQGKILGIVPKRDLPTYGEFYEKRHFSSGPKLTTVTIGDVTVPFGQNLIFRFSDLLHARFAVEICEDLWSPEPPSGRHAQKGATIICNLSASNETIGKADFRRKLVTSQSGRLVCAYLYADAGMGESTTDLVFSGHHLIAENGQLLEQTMPFEDKMAYTDIDLDRLRHDRRRMDAFKSIAPDAKDYCQIDIDLPIPNPKLVRKIPKTPFVPYELSEREDRCEEIFAIISRGLETRLEHIGLRRVILGLSGGLDSTLALLICLRAFRALDLDLSGLLAITMPGFGTSDTTYKNAVGLSKALGISLREIPIEKSVLAHFEDIGHRADLHDATYENAQARERTQILMDLSNKEKALMIGTGDLSELALGWTTYNGDHMSMYAVNASVPKTLVRYLVAYEASRADQTVRDFLEAILATPISPELAPVDKGLQATEELIGPYVLHDFFLYHLMRYGMTPQKIFYLATVAFEGDYTPDDIRACLRLFIQRFFSQQFKRSCLPDGPLVGSVSLSPRGTWRMPSDAVSDLWLAFLDDM